MKTFELIIDNPETDEVVALSLVEFPAIEADWVYFNKEEIKFATVDTDKKIIIAPVLIPEKRILRLSGDGEQYQVYLSADTIEKLAQNYINKGYQQNATLEHNDRIDGDISVVESWVSKSREKDKSSLYFDRSFPAGTWFVSMKVNSDDLWNDYVKTGKIKAISIEGFFEHKLVQASRQLPISFKNVDEFNEEEAEMFLSKIKQLFESYADYGDDIKNNAKRGIELNEKNNNKCATQTGKVRAQQLANGEAISVDTIQRMYSYLSRAETYYDNADSENDCGHISFMLWGGKSALSWSKNKLEELGLVEAETAVSVSSTYAGGFGTGSVKMVEDCPIETQDISVNLANRQNAIDKANYGPENPNEPNEDYWIAKAKQFKGDISAAKTALCGNCAFFDQKQKTLDCIAQGIGGEDAYDVIDAGDLGLCLAFDFKCASKRTCSAWVAGGPLTD
jgi:hypothetical protein